MSHYSWSIVLFTTSCVVSLRLVPDHGEQTSSEEQSAALFAGERYEALRINGYISERSVPNAFYASDTKERATKRIVAVGKYLPSGKLECPSSTCIVSTDVKDAPHADAIVYSAPFAAFPKDLLHLRQDQKLIFSFFYESQLRFGKRARPRVNAVNPYVNWTMTFHPKSDFFWPMASFIREQPKDYVKTLATNATRKRTTKILALLSNCQRDRMQYIHKLQNVLNDTLMIYGKCGKKVPCEGRDESSACYQQFFKGFDFFLALENTRCSGYVTEKVFRAFENGMVPIVNGGFGRQDYDRLGIPRDAYLHVDDFSSLQDIAEHIRHMDDLNYSKFFAWQEHSKVQKTGLQSYCQVCEELVKPRADQKADRSFGESLSSWFFAADTCRT